MASPRTTYRVRMAETDRTLISPDEQAMADYFYQSNSQAKWARTSIENFLDDELAVRDRTRIIGYLDWSRETRETLQACEDRLWGVIAADLRLITNEEGEHA